MYIQFVCALALENARLQSYIELQKMEQFPQPPFSPETYNMTVQVNHKKLYYNYYTFGKYLLKIQISGKILRQHPPPQLQMLCYVLVD
jgi:hypothetical protein